ncbi:hypothetical protein PgNI_06231 [Pyricularia grisea]|uniref:Extracellular membrane protein CFEM domain-containing protein n=1 Tax=Pyricularia grisea TaxID=148305 RepID=A0A6P8B4M9_PYRGI|nr:hypothetical protein PgNI_06231 [Pyricularia grisea]TLD10291.1 hypothetical protein PgNI_06231 [Pyricularia grisea]
MHQRQAPRSSLLFTILLAATIASAATSPSKRTECITSRSSELISVAACGHKETLRQCFSNPDHYGWGVNAQAQDLKICFLNAGCSPEAAQIEAEWTIRRCDEGSRDLRKRRDPQEPISPPAAPIAARMYDSLAPTPTPTAHFDTRGGGDVLAKRQDQPPQPTAQPQLLGGFMLFECYSTATTRQEVCTTAPGSSRQECADADVPFYKCIDGKICRPDAAGLPGCVDGTQTITTSGFVVAGIFGLAILVATITICTCCIRDRNANKRLSKASELAAMQREARANELKQRPTIDVRAVSSSSEPLMGGGGGGGVAQTEGTGYVSPHPGARHDPFSENVPYHDRR